MPRPTKDAVSIDIAKDYMDLNKDREFWLELTELENIKVCRYMLDFMRKDQPNKEIIRDFIIGWMQDAYNECREWGDLTQIYCV